MQFHYSTDTKDLRAAMYYGVLMRNAAFGRIMLVLLPLALLYFFGVTCGLWPDIPAISYVVLACGIWVLILLGNAERAIMKHSHSADSLLGVGIDVKIQDNWLFVDIADRNFHFKGKLSELAGAVELKRVVLLYVNAQQTFIIPKRAAGRGVLHALSGAHTRRPLHPGKRRQWNAALCLLATEEISRRSKPHKAAGEAVLPPLLFLSLASDSAHGVKFSC